MTAHSITANPQVRLPDDVTPVACADRLIYAHMERPDLLKASSFLRDFGLIEVQAGAEQVFFRGVGPSPFIYKVTRGNRARFAGFGLSVPAHQDLARLAAKTGAPITENPDPGGGAILRLRDPDGVAVELVHGQAPATPLPARASMQHNAPDRTLRVNSTQRPPLVAPDVQKLGHLVLGTPNFARAATWYMETLGFLPSDVLCLPDGTPAAAFLRLNLGGTPADHHTIFITLNIESGLDHLAFEVADLDAVEMGQQLLKARQYRHAWGVGRHLLGSQIFDYWRDPWGQKHEHYADGDLFDAAQPAGYHPMDKKGLYQWGPDLPADFVDTRMTPARLFKLMRGALRGEIKLAPLIAAKKSMSAAGRPWQG